jgi:hypothetical protein
MRYILCLIASMVILAGELAAQTRGSAAQIVTFGVRRIATPASHASDAPSVKITIGDQSQPRTAVEYTSLQADRSTFSTLSTTNEFPASHALVTGYRTRSTDVPANRSTVNGPASKTLLTVTQ